MAPLNLCVVVSDGKGQRWETRSLPRKGQEIAEKGQQKMWKIYERNTTNEGRFWKEGKKRSIMTPTFFIPYWSVLFTSLHTHLMEFQQCPLFFCLISNTSFFAGFPFFVLVNGVRYCVEGFFSALLGAWEKVLSSKNNENGNEPWVDHREKDYREWKEMWERNQKVRMSL